MSQKLKPNKVLVHIFKGLAAISVIALSACGNQPRVPDWALNAEAAAQKATQAYLQGQQRVETLQWQKARDAVASTGQPALAAKVELMRCAAQVASLDWNNCSAYEALAQDADQSERAYAQYLKGELHPSDVGQLPQAQRAAVGAIAASGLSGLAKVQDPLSRLVAAGVMLRAGSASAELLQLGVDTASEQGWRRALMAWLLLQQQAAERAGDMGTSGQIQRRLKLLQMPGAK
ncbi:hypothetical protein KUF54_09820 [Comamonas sp. Y33R10-2]|uniref:hypothetical protein n=1 Tax=Comamonas sp. Y33R10-2 TaxID=2853257 RepID=UPI001C5C831B|nr:hypothetical protein [Comamonas sp. Y33R10-2]QXZ08405.1 hypothetical protein KUF54_09820 [Comamonas sp. Y33R10-2]